MFKEGNKLGGRKPGSKNKTTEEIRGLFSELLTNNLDTIQTDLDNMKPEERVKTLIALSKFVIPTLKATEVSTTDTERKTIVINLGSGINPEADPV